MNCLSNKSAGVPQKDIDASLKQAMIFGSTFQEKGERMDKPFDLRSAIRLEDAYFCLSCEAVTNCSDTCPFCGHRYLWSLQNWLGRVNGPEFSKYRKSATRKIEAVRTL